MGHVQKEGNKISSPKVSHGIQQQPGNGASFQFQDNRTEANVQRNMQSLADKSTARSAVQLKIAPDLENKVFQKKANTTGMPDKLKSGVENLSGLDMSDVKVHYNSLQPAQLNAHAYAQGRDIHIAPGQEKHLPHEAWHVVQQKQGRVRATVQMKGGVAVNDDKGLESEADLMGGRAAHHDIWQHEKQYEKNLISKSCIAQCKADLFINSSGLKTVRTSDIQRLYGEFELKKKGGSTYRHMSPKSLRLNAGHQGLMDLLQSPAFQPFSQIIENARKVLSELEVRMDSWERRIEDTNDQFQGDSKRNGVLAGQGESNLYDSISLEHFIEKNTLNSHFIAQDLGALARQLAYKHLVSRFAQPQTFDIIFPLILAEIKTSITDTGNALGINPKIVLDALLTAAYAQKEIVFNTYVALIQSHDSIIKKGTWYGDSTISGDQFARHKGNSSNNNPFPAAAASYNPVSAAVASQNNADMKDE